MVDQSIDDASGFAFYHYKPAKPGAIIFVLVFITMTVFHSFQMKLLTVEWIGYIERAVSSDQSPNWTLGPNILQTLLLLLAPALLSASIYSHAPLGRKWLTKVFVYGDVMSFLLQAAGGGIQSGGSPNNAKIGSHVIVVVLFVQIAFFGFLSLWQHHSI
ncbi:hypothetical protein N7467_000011 [Penicillium canescens]|nr:hypothetical protein N7467_000011 [Penicillium canescens]